MIEKLTDYLIKRRLNKKHHKLEKDGSNKDQFLKVMNTLSTNRIVVKYDPDGVFIRFAGLENRDELYSTEFLKVINFGVSTQSKIRNQLSPYWNLVAMIENYELEDPDEQHQYLQLIIKESKNIKKHQEEILNLIKTI